MRAAVASTGMSGSASSGPRDEEGSKGQPTSRLCIKNLPKYVDDARLRDHFAAQGDVTDVKVMCTSNGKSRCFGFVGYATVETATSALAHFDRSFLDTARLIVEYAQPYSASAAVAGAWSRHSRGTSAYARAHPEGQADKAGQAAGPITGANATPVAAGSDDPRFAEFMALMRPRQKQALWADGGSTGPGADRAEADPDTEAAGSDDEYVDLKDREEEGEADGEESDTSSEPAPKPVDPVVADAGVSDMEYMRSRKVVEHFSDEEDGGGEDGSGEEGGDKAVSEEAAAAHANDEAPSAEAPSSVTAPSPGGGLEPPPGDAPAVSETGRLFVRNLPYAATEGELRTAFEACGPVASASIVLDPLTRRSKGFAMVQYVDKADAERALGEFDGAIFQGRLLHVLPGKPQVTRLTREGSGEAAAGGQSYKDRAEIARRLKAGSAEDARSWNALYFRPDTVLEAVAAHFGVAKAELLDREAPDVAVRLALGEAQVMQATKAALEEAGVDVGVLEQSPGQSEDAVLILKNLPWSTTAASLRALFGADGDDVTIVLPPTRALALVAFDGHGPAQRAMHRLAYRRHEGVPLYVQWAPRGVLRDLDKARARDAARGAGPDKPAAAPADAGGGPPGAKATRAAQSVAASTAHSEPVQTSTLFVKNLAWETTDEGLRRHCEAIAAQSLAGTPLTIRTARVATRRKTPAGPLVSAGFGFVECGDVAQAAALCTPLNGSALDGHQLAVQGAKGGAEEGTPAPGPAPSAKIMVRNVAFQATRKDILALFGAFGEIKSCRLPQKFDGSARGFAFVEFASPAEAKKGIQGVQGAHLYGRRLVIETANGDDADGRPAQPPQKRAKRA